LRFSAYRSVANFTVENTDQRPAHYVRLIAPWASLGYGIFSAITMDRAISRAPMLVAIAAAAWVLLVLLAVGFRPNAQAAAPHGLRWRIARHLSLAGAQWAVQSALFFALPFYGWACAWSAPHVLFVATLAAVATATLWDPFTAWMFEHPLRVAILPALSTGAALNVVLPALGASNRASLWATALSVWIGAAVLTWTATRRSSKPEQRWHGLGAGALVPLALVCGAARFVPPAPLRLVTASMQRGLVGATISSAGPMSGRLVCETTILAPQGLHDQVVHVWKQNGVTVNRIRVGIQGSRGYGYHTWSYQPASASAGSWSCSIETISGQFLGERRTHLTAMQTGRTLPDN
jgi:hypothetical protein